MNKEHEGKVMAGVLQDFLPALKEIAELGSMNNKPNGKYERGSWLEVKNANVLYLDAFWRHQLEGMYNKDPETNKIHLVAMAWNLLALLTFHLKLEKRITMLVAEDFKMHADSMVTSLLKQPRS